MFERRTENGGQSMDKYELWFNTLINNSDEGFIIVDKDGVILEINEQYCKFLRLNRQDALGRKIEEFIPNTSMYEVMKRRMTGESGEAWSLNYATPTADYTAIGNRFCIFNNDGEVIGAIAQVKFRDRTWYLADYLYQKELNDFQSGIDVDKTEDPFGALIGRNEKFLALKEKASRIAKRDFTVFLSGETGTGKEVFARAIHAASDRRDKPMVCINCGAIPPDLLESELFGYEEGAFTGAKRGGKPGKFELANQGTIFLDEIGDLPFDLQVKLLRVLQEGEIEKIGGNKAIPINVRVISATRRDLEEMMVQGTFREDLYYRLNIINLNILPLRERREDILLFAYHFLEELNRKYKTEMTFSPAVEQRLQAYHWPGNIRELKNVVSSAYASNEGLVIDLDDLPPKIGKPQQFTEPLDQSLRTQVQTYEAHVIRAALEQTGQSIKDTAALLNIDRSLLWKKMKKYNIEIEKVLK